MVKVRWGMEGRGVFWAGGSCAIGRDWVKGCQQDRSLKHYSAEVAIPLNLVRGESVIEVSSHRETDACAHVKGHYIQYT